MDCFMETPVMIQEQTSNKGIVKAPGEEVLEIDRGDSCTTV